MTYNNSASISDIDATIIYANNVKGNVVKIALACKMIFAHSVINDIPSCKRYQSANLKFKNRIGKRKLKSIVRHDYPGSHETSAKWLA